MDLAAGAYTASGLQRLNVVLGKNGAGKSRFLKALDTSYVDETLGEKRYITPERGGVLKYEPNVDLNMSNTPDWLLSSRRVNQFRQFREQSMAQFRKFELSAYRLAEERGEIANFQQYIAQLNSLLDNIEVYRAEGTLQMRLKGGGEDVAPEDVSSGEAEAISLGIEILTFAVDAEPEKLNLLFLDSPDVHLHPDLQSRLTAFLAALAAGHDFRVVIATHSTALLGGLLHRNDSAVAFLRAGDNEIEFRSLSQPLEAVLPVFGAHPLSNVFNESPVLLLEGEDDVRLWQQVVRSSGGAISLYPIACGSVNAMHDYELEVQRIVASVYDHPRAYSLRDRDDGPEEIDDVPPVVRMRLHWRAGENLILANEVLASVGVSWEDVQYRVTKWLERNPDHPRFEPMKAFADDGFDRTAADLKDLRMLLVGEILASTKPWEVLVGQAIASLQPPAGAAAPDGSLIDALGDKVVQHLLPGGG